jgi:hypothetical protein
MDYCPKKALVLKKQMWMNQQNDNEYLQRLHSKDRAQPLLGRRHSATKRAPLLEAAQDTESDGPRGRPASRRRPPGGAGRGGAVRAAAWQLHAPLAPPPSPCAQPPDLNCRFSDPFALVVSAPLFYLACRPLLDFS